MGGAEKGRDQEGGDEHRDGGGEGDGPGLTAALLTGKCTSGLRSSADNNNNILSSLLSSILKLEDQYLVVNCFVMMILTGLINSKCSSFNST